MLEVDTLGLESTRLLEAAYGLSEPRLESPYFTEIEEKLSTSEVYGYIQLMLYDNQWVLENINFGLPLSSLNISGFVADAVINNQVMLSKMVCRAEMPKLQIAFVEVVDTCGTPRLKTRLHQHTNMN